MALSILQQPQALTFVGNIPELIVQTDGLNLTVNISIGEDLILSESYTADADGRVRVRLRDFLDERLTFSLPAGDLFEQTGTVRQIDVEIIAGTDSTEISFVAIKGGVDKALLDCAAYLKKAWLTWQPQTKHVKDVDPEWLSYFAVAAAVVKVKAYFSGGTSETITLHELEAAKHYTMNMCFSDIREEFELQPIYFDVWVESGEEETYHQRYILTDEAFDYDDLFVFENSVGGLDTIRLTGEKRAINPVEVDAALFYDESTFDYQVNPNKAYEKNTGFFRSKDALYWAQDFFQALKKYLYLEEELIQIQLRNPEIVTMERELVDFDFKFAYTRQTRYLALFKKKSPLIDPIIIGPGDEEFYLPPKISDFPQLDDPTSALFPVQIPGTPGWFFLTWTTLLEHFYEGMPLPNHNALPGLQGGIPAIGSAPAQRNHLSDAELSDVQSIPEIQSDLTDLENQVQGIEEQQEEQDGRIEDLEARPLPPTPGFGLSDDSGTWKLTDTDLGDLQAINIGNLLERIFGFLLPPFDGGGASFGIFGFDKGDLSNKPKIYVDFSNFLTANGVGFELAKEVGADNYEIKFYKDTAGVRQEFTYTTDGRIVIVDNLNQRGLGDADDYSATKLDNDYATKKMALPAGGTTGQVAKKQSNTSYDVAWEDESGGGLKLVAFSTVILDSGNFKSQHIQVEAIAYTATISDASVNFANTTEHYLRASGAHGKPTFSSAFLIMLDNWNDGVDKWNFLKFKILPSAKVAVWIYDVSE